VSRGRLFLFFSLCLPSLLLPGPAPVQAATASLSVRALDPQGAPIPGATAVLDTRDGRLRRRGTTGPEGRHSFAELAAGDYLVSVAARGFATPWPRRLRLDAGAQLEIEIDLALAGVEESLVVTAASAPQSGLELQKALTAVTAAEIDERGESSVAEALRRVAGVRVQQRGGPGTLTSIHVRGLRTHDTAVLIDGVRFRDPAGTQADASAFLSDLLAVDVERVEVLRGSGASLYGSHAIGGVVNVLTERGGGPTRGSLLTEGGSLGFFRGRGQLAGGSPGGELAWSAGLVQMNAFEGVDGDEPARNTSGLARLQWSPAPQASLTARLWLADAGLRLTESPQALGAVPASGIVDAVALDPVERRRFEAGTPVAQLSLGDATFIPNAADPDSRRESRFLSSLVRFEHRPTARLGWSVSYHGLWTDRAFFDGPLGSSGFEPALESRSDFDGRLHTLQARADLALGSEHLLTAGWELEQESFENRTHDGDPRFDSLAAATQRSHTGFAQLQLSLLGGELRLAASGRGQFFELERPRLVPLESSPYRDAPLASPTAAWTGDVSAVVRLGREGTRLRAHLGNGYRAPSLYERFGSFFGSFGYSVFGDPRLGPERSLGIDAGLDHRFAGGRWRVSATAFQTELREVIVFDSSGAIDPATDPFGRFGGYASSDGGRSRGLELELSAQPLPGLSLEAAWTWTHAEPPAAGAPDADRAYAIPRHQLGLVATRHLGDAYLNLELAFAGSTLAPLFDPVSFASRSYRFAPMRRVDLGGGWRLRLEGDRRLRLFARLDNLLDRELHENGFRSPGRTAVAGAALEF
jgi:iron complex outermembrane receptor protein